MVAGSKPTHMMTKNIIVDQHTEEFKKKYEFNIADEA